MQTNVPDAWGRKWELRGVDDRAQIRSPTIGDIDWL